MVTSTTTVDTTAKNQDPLIVQQVQQAVEKDLSLMQELLDLKWKSNVVTFRYSSLFYTNSFLVDTKDEVLVLV
jgi:hypothetical protein